MKATTISQFDGPVCSIAVSSRGGKVAAGAGTSVVVFDGPPSYGARSELRAQAGGVTAVAFSHRGSDVVAGGADGFLKWWQVESGDETCSTLFPAEGGGPDASIPEVSCSRDGFVAATSGRFVFVCCRALCVVRC